MSVLRKKIIKWLIGSRPEPLPPWWAASMRLWILRDIRAEECLRKFMSIVEQAHKPFRPTHWTDYSRPYPAKIQWDDFSGLLKEWRSDILSVETYTGPTRGGDPLVHWSVRTVASMKDLPPNIATGVEEQGMADVPGGWDYLVELTATLSDAFEVTVGSVRWACNWMDRPSPYRPPFYISIPDIDWIMVFGPEYVEFLGEDELKSVVCHEVRRLAYGGYMLVLTQTPQESVTAEGKALARGVKEHLGIEYFYDPSDGTNNRECKQRKTPDLDWSKVPFSSPYVAAEHRLVKDAQAFIDQVPEMVDSLRARVADGKNKLDCTPQSLDHIDSWLTLQHDKNIPYEQWKSPDIEREVAAYIGEIVRASLGGAWAVEDVDGLLMPVVRFSERKGGFINAVAMAEDAMECISWDASDEEDYCAQLRMHLQEWLFRHAPLEGIKDLFSRQ